MDIYMQPGKESWSALTRRPTLDKSQLEDTVKAVFAAVKDRGDAALTDYTLRFDQVELSAFLVTEKELLAAETQITDPLKVAIAMAKHNIETFHAAQLPEQKVIETAKGVCCWQEVRPIEKVGIYIPGGTAPLFSTVLMLAIPAKIAGCGEIVLCTPPRRDGTINPLILYAAQQTGVTKIIKAGGIQAIAALTYGTTSVPKVNKLFGPGNQYVTAAKQQAFQEGIAIDLPAGPSELLIVADESANPKFIAADLLSQAEHGADSQVVCIVNKPGLLEKIKQEMDIQLNDLPRAEIARQALMHARLICLENRSEIMDFVNEYAPEHLILCTQENDFYRQKVVNAGSVFLGNYSPESAGDYASGTNHTLPTGGFAKSYSGVSTEAFLKKISFQEITPEGLLNIGTSIEAMAAAENLQAHKNAVTLRLNALK